MGSLNRLSVRLLFGSVCVCVGVWMCAAWYVLRVRCAWSIDARWCLGVLLIDWQVLMTVETDVCTAATATTNQTCLYGAFSPTFVNPPAFHHPPQFAVAVLV